MARGAKSTARARRLPVCAAEWRNFPGRPRSPKNTTPERPYFAHDSACVDDGAEIGAGTKIWHYSHIMKGARIGERCVIGQNVNVDGGSVIGNNVKIPNNVSVYAGRRD